MCSALVQTFFFLALILSTGLIATSLLTPFLRNAKLEELFKPSSVLLEKYCSDQIDNKTGDFKTDCVRVFDRKEQWEKTALISLGLSLLLCFLALGWSIIYCLGCCFKSCLVPPLPVLTGLATIALSVGVAIYAAKSDTNAFEKVISDWSELKELEGESDFVVSMWLALAAIALLIVDTISGIILVRLHTGPLPSPV